MNKFLLIIFFLPFTLFANSQKEYEVAFKQGYICVQHIALKGETLTSIANDYFVKPSSLATVNRLNGNVDIRINQLLLIPLLETNYFKMLGISSGQKGFCPVLYTPTTEDDILSICRKFSLTQQAFLKWNDIAEEDKINANKSLIVGWLKYTKVHTNEQGNAPIAINKVKSTAIEKKPVTNVGYASKTTKANPSTTTNQLKPSKQLKESVYSDAKNASASPNRIYREGERRKENRLGSFFNRINSKLKSKDKHDSVTTVKTSDKVIRTEKNTATNEAPKKKKSIKEIWNNLVNGKEIKKASPIEAKPEIKLQPKSTTVKATPQKTNSNNSSTKKISNIPTEKKTLVKKSDIPAKPKAQVPTATKSVDKAKVNTKDEKVLTKKTLVVEKKEVEVAKVSAENTTDKKEPTSNDIINSEVKALTFSRSKLGKCAYFFSGPISGKFYAFTNVAMKGEIVKVTNTLNNKSVMAEVIGILPKADENKGLLLKISDNAKLPLRQKSGQFSIKVNY